jgi:hypothetical protein
MQTTRIAALFMIAAGALDDSSDRGVDDAGVTGVR